MLSIYLSVCLSVSLSLSHIQTHTHTHTRTHKLVRIVTSPALTILAPCPRPALIAYMSIHDVLPADANRTAASVIVRSAGATHPRDDAGSVDTLVVEGAVTWVHVQAAGCTFVLDGYARTCIHYQTVIKPC